jgi:hypothetical protein
MKPSEELASRYLSSLGLSPIIYEPDGNVPPDFLVDGKIAVEVRRMNYTAVGESGTINGIESAQFALLSGIRRLLPLLGPPLAGQSWFVHYTFTRPLLPVGKLMRGVRDVLVAFRDGRIQGTAFSVNGSFRVGVIPSTKVFPDFFVLGGFSDRDAGGWLVGELEKNIRNCVREKSAKIARVRAKYPEWWLLLVDHIGYGQMESLQISHDWEKVILINPLDPKVGYEL